MKRKDMWRNNGQKLLRYHKNYKSTGPSSSMRWNEENHI